MNPFTVLWLLWGVIFLTFEGIALRLRHRAPGGTLSQLVWRFIGPGHRVHRAVFAVGWLVLTSHFFLRLP